MTGRAPTLIALAALGLVAGVASVRAGEHAATSRTVRGVVELFTSQGCSPCPPADRILGDLSKDPGIVALAYHVNYWDYIGWVDTHGSRANTERQRAYAKGFGTGVIYTPQVVVNGQRDVVGSRAARIAAAIAETALTRINAEAWVSLAVEGDRLHIAADGVAPDPSARPPVLMLVTFDDRTETVVGKGENKGLTLVDSHAVRDWRILGMWDGKPLDVDIPIATLKRDAGTRSGYAAILQTVTEGGAPGPILAAAALEF